MLQQIGGTLVRLPQNPTPTVMFKDTFKEITKSLDLESLQCLTAVRVVISVCESEDMQRTIGKMHKDIGDSPAGFSDSQWHLLQGRARKKLNQIGVFGLIIDIILEKLWPISFEIFKWIIYHAKNIGIECSSYFCWTPHFNIDYENTAKILSKNEAFDIKKRFKLACLHCLEQEARFLWDVMNISERRFFFARENLKKSNQNPIVLYWTYYIQEVPLDYWNNKALNHTQLFKYAVQNGHLSATKFFFGQLKRQLRSKMIINSFCIYFCSLNKSKCFEKEHFAIACFLICEICPNYWGIQSFTMLHLIFLNFLEWPMQKHFMAVVNQMSGYLDKRRFGDLLLKIFEKDLGDFKDYDYKTLFMEFWLQNPGLYQTYVNTESRIGFEIFMKFIKKHFEFIFEESSFELKVIFRTVVLQRNIPEYDGIFEKENVEFFKFLLRERVTLKSSIDRFLYRRFITFPFPEFGIPFFKVSLNELMFLIDSVSGTV